MNDRSAPQQRDPTLGEALALAETDLDAVIVMAEEGDIVAFSAGAERLYGHSEEQARAIGAAGLVPEGRGDDWPALLASCRSGRGTSARRATRRDRAGRSFDVMVSVMPLAIAGGETDLFVVIERPLDESAREGGANADSLDIEAAMDAVVRQSLDGSITGWNLAAARILGFNAAEAIGRPLTMLLPPGRRGENQRLLSRLRRGETIRGHETIWRGKSRALVDVALTMGLEKNPEGTPTGAWLIARDITERKRSESALRVTNRELEDIVARRTEMLELLLDLASEANDAENFSGALSYALRRLGEFNGWEFGQTFLREEGESGRLECHPTHYSGSGDEYQPFRQATLEACHRGEITVPDRVRADGSSRWLDDLAHELEPRRAHVAAEVGFRTGAIFPIVARNNVLGVVEFFSTQEKEVDDRVLEMMLGAGTQLGRVLERRRLNATLSGAMIREQRRIGRDLHDTVGQMLAATALGAERLGRRLEAGERVEQDQLIGLAGEIREALESVRLASRGLMPVLSGEDALPAALEDLTRGIAKYSDVEFVLDFTSPVEIADPVSGQHLFRIGAEAINNAVRHAQAKRIVVAIAKSGGELTLSVSDDGTGIGDASQRAPGMGLRTMAHHAEIIGGVLEIGERQGGGTAITCKLPEQFSHD